MTNQKIQLSNYIYCDELFNHISINNPLLANQYKDYPYLIINDFFSSELCKEIVDSSKENEKVKVAQVKANSTKGIVVPKINQKFRKTNILKWDDEFKDIYQKQFLNFQPMIEKYFNAPITYSTKVQMLQYKKGFFYIKHSDDSSELIDANKNTVGFTVVAPRRKLTTVLFTTTCDEQTTSEYHFSGGELIFNYLYDKDNNQIKFKPKAGDMIVFPSNPYFSHEVLTVESGYRLTLVQWHDTITL
jgi:SM-20-related protein